MFENTRGTLAVEAMGATRIQEMPTLQQRLTREKAALEDKLRIVDKALMLLEKNPDLAEVVNALSRIGY